MHDIKAIRDNPDAFGAALKRREIIMPVELLGLDGQLRSVQKRLQELQTTRNAESQKIGEIKKAGGDAQAQMNVVASLKAEMAELEESGRRLAEELKKILEVLPNVLADDVPDGAGEQDNKEVRKVGTPPRRNDNPDHSEIGARLGMMDFETAAKMSGSRFTILSGGLARLERALAQFMLDTHTGEHGYTEVSPPLLVRDNAVYGTGQLPKFKQDLYAVEHLDADKFFTTVKASLKRVLKYEDSVYEKPEFKNVINATIEEFFNDPKRIDKLFELDTDSEVTNRKWLIPTSEVPLTNIVADSIVDEESLPRRYTAFTPCFRSEAGAAGKDTSGMLRQHQFYKVELVSITTPEKSAEEHERMTKCAETILERLGLPFRTMVLCSADTGFGATKTYDIEVWLPGQGKYREISSCSNCGDFQARRMEARCRPKGGKGGRYVHTLNGSGVAVGRALIAVVENYWDGEGVVVPEVLRPYMGGLKKIVKA